MTLDERNQVMTLDERNRIHAAIERQIEDGTSLSVETGGSFNDFVPIDCGDEWEVQIRVRIKKTAIAGGRS